jgi:hypothetical protein
MEKQANKRNRVPLHTFSMRLPLEKINAIDTYRASKLSELGKIPSRMAIVYSLLDKGMELEHIASSPTITRPD